MATLGDLLLKLDVDSSRFRESLDKAANDVSGFVRKVETIGKVLGAAFAADVVKDAASALSHFVMKGAEAADQMGKLAQSTGVPVEKLSRLAYAASLSDLSTEELGMGLTKLNKAMMAAAQGGDEQIRLFDALGVKFKEAGKLRDPIAVFQDLATQFKAMPDSAEKTAIAMEFFSKSGAKMIPLLNSGADGLKQMGEESDKLGKTIDDKAYKSAEAFNDNLTRMKAAMDGVATRAAAKLTPMLVNLGNELLTTTGKTGALEEAASVLAATIKILVSGGVILAGVFNVVGKALGSVGAAVVLAAQGEFKLAKQALQDGGEDMADTVMNMGKRLQAVWAASAEIAGEGAEDNATKSTADLAAILAKLRKSSPEVKKATESLTTAILEYQKKISGFGKGAGSDFAQLKFEVEFGKFAEAAKKAGKEGAKMVKVLLDLGATYEMLKRGEKVSESMEKVTEEINKTKTAAAGAKTEYEQMLLRISSGDLAKEMRTAIENGADPDTIAHLEGQLLDAAKAQDELARKTKATQNFMEEFNRTVDDASQVWEETRTPAEKYTEQIEKLNKLLAKGAIDQQTYERAAKGAKKTFEEADESAKKLREFAEDASKSLTDVFGKQMEEGFSKGLTGMVNAFGDAVRQMIIKALAAQLQQRLLGGLTSLGTALGFGTPATPGRATGGTVMANTSYLVGERGVPEVFTPNVSGSIIPLEERRGKQKGGAPAQPYLLQIHPDAMHMTLSEWFQGEMARQAAAR